MPSILQLKEQRAQTWSAMCEIDERAKTGELSAEDRSAYEAAEKALESQTGELERQERHEALQAKLEAVDYRGQGGSADLKPGGGQGGERTSTPDEEYRDAFVAYMRDGFEGLSQEHRSALRAGAVQDKELRAQSSTPATAGGFTIPQGFWAKVTETMKEFGGMMQVANILETDTGAKLPWPTNDDTGNVGEQIGENTAVSEQDLVFGSKDLDAFIFSSKMVKVPWALLQDTGVPMESYLARKLGERLGRIHNVRQTLGNGTTQPEGVLTNARIGLTTAAGQVAALTYDNIIDLEHSVDPAYRAGGRCRFLFNDLTLRSLRKVKDTEGRPLWEPSLQTGAPDNFNGRPYTINQDMPTLAAGAKAIAFGDFNAGFVIRIVKNATLVRLNERFAESLQVAFFAYDRMDSAQDDAAAYAVVQQAAA